MKAYVARPEKKGKYAAVVIIHENRGLNAHIEDVARRAAKAGFLAIAPNALAPLGGTPANEDEARQKFQQLKAEDSLLNFIRVFDYLNTRKDVTGKYGCVGFCWGGAMANSLAVEVPSLKAAVAFYGRQPERVNAGAVAYEAALKENKINYELYMYDGVNHAFHNDSAPTRYNEAAAKLAWQRSMDFFKKYLG